MEQDSKIIEDFDKFVEKISLNQRETDDIIEKHNGLTEMIKCNPPKDYKVVRTRLSGSYAKRTVLNEKDEASIPDVDIVVVIETEKNDVDEINSDFLEYFKERKDKVAQEVRQQSNSIGVIYKNISVDLVLGKQDENDSLIITSHKNNDWLESNALKHVDFMTKKNKEYEINYYSLMKLFKYLNKNYITNSLKSFTLEMLIHQCVPKYDVDQTMPQIFTDTLANILNLESIEDLKDCIDVSKTAYDEKDKYKFDFFKNEMRSIYNKAIQAVDGDRKKWEEIFGSDFPKQPEEKAKNNNSYDRSQNPWCLNEIRRG